MYNSYVKKCVRQYKKDFQDDWIERLDWSSIQKAEESFSLAQTQINNFIIFCFVNIAKSLLSGEYIVNRKKFTEAKYHFEQYLDQDLTCPVEPELETHIIDLKIKLYELYGLLVTNLKELFYKYTAFVVSVDEKLDYSQTIYLLKGYTENTRFIRSFRFFRVLRNILIPLCEYEHYLEFSDDFRKKVAQCVEELYLIKNTESNQEVLEVIEFALYKANFILKKLIRKESSFHILINYEKKIITRDSIQNLPKQIARFFRFYENVHEDEPYDRVEMQAIQIKVGNKNGSLLDMALLMDYYCSIKLSMSQIDNLLKDFEHAYRSLFHKTFHYEFDNHALATLRNYMYNCRLSYRLQQKDYTLNELELDMKDIESLQLETLVNNFYPFKKALEYLESLLKSKIKSRDIFFDYQYAIDLFSRYLSKLDNNIEWCESHKFYPIQLGFKECLVDVEGFKLILPSSITRPIDYKRLRECQSQLHASLEYFKTSQIYIKDREDTEAIKEELKGVEKRYFEIGGILIGVVTFLFGTINIFTQSQASPSAMFYSVLGLGIILLIFACVTVLVSELIGSRKPNKFRVWIFSILIIIYSIFVYSLATNKSFSNNIKGEDTAIIIPEAN